MSNKIFYLLVSIAIITSCGIKGQSIDNENENLYIQALDCVFEFRFDNKQRLSEAGVLNIYENYYIDTTTLYYDTQNFGFHLEFIDKDSHSYKNATEKRWNKYKTFSSYRGKVKAHNRNISDYKHKNIRFLSKADIEKRKKKNDVFIYSPLIPFDEDHYLIYETFYYSQSEYDFGYKLKKVDDGFQLVDYSYYVDYLTSDVDYMKTIDFTLTYEEFLRSQK